MFYLAKMFISFYRFLTILSNYQVYEKKGVELKNLRHKNLTMNLNVNHTVLPEPVTLLH